MKVCFEQFLNSWHSWGVVGQNLARQFLNENHEVHLKSTNGYQPFAEGLKPFVKEKLDAVYDVQISYTAMMNFPRYLSHGPKNRLGIYNFDGTILPSGWAKYVNFTDKLLPSSNFSKQIFLDNKIPEEKLEVVHHGINLEDFSVEPFKFKTTKNIKILNVLGQAHYRKNVEGILEVYGKAFNKKDDVCLILKCVNKEPTQIFEVSIQKILNNFKRKYPQHAEIEILTDYIENIESLFVASDIHFSLSRVECFHIPSLQAIAAGKIAIASNWGGNTDFMNNDNSYLISGKLVRAPKEAQYWNTSPYATMFEPNVDDAVSKLKYVVENYQTILEQKKSNIISTAEEFTWNKMYKKIINLCQI